MKPTILYLYIIRFCCDLLDVFYWHISALLDWWRGCTRVHDAITTSSLSQNDITVSFWRNDYIAIASWARRVEMSRYPRYLDISGSSSEINGLLEISGNLNSMSKPNTRTPTPRQPTDPTTTTTTTTTYPNPHANVNRSKILQETNITEKSVLCY